MGLPGNATASTVLIEVVRISALPARPGAPYPGATAALRAGDEAGDALALMARLPEGVRHRCGFPPGWSVRA